MFIKIMGYVYYYGAKLVDASSVSLKDLHFLYSHIYGFLHEGLRVWWIIIGYDSCST